MLGKMMEGERIISFLSLTRLSLRQETSFALSTSIFPDLDFPDNTHLSAFRLRLYKYGACRIVVDQQILSFSATAFKQSNCTVSPLPLNPTQGAQEPLPMK